MLLNNERTNLETAKAYLTEYKDEILKVQTNPYNRRVMRIVYDSDEEWIERLTHATEMKLINHAENQGILHEHGRFW